MIMLDGKARKHLMMGYSLAVVIDCPPGTPVTWDGKDGNDE
jgi:hypothetical protein